MSFASLLIHINVIIYQNTFGYLTLYICNKTSRTRDVSSYCFLILRPKSKMPSFLSFRYVLLWKNNHFETRSALTYFYYRITWMNIPIDVTWLLLVVKISCISLCFGSQDYVRMTQKCQKRILFLFQIYRYVKSTYISFYF